ncbi:histidine kinase [Streptomyces sp. NPDC088350]|uniref:ATP-binding protein n=1 Tax=Streptomyces sp. NPDC088350 TaxID=3365854 RepID=UPI0037FBDE59
MIAPAAVAAAVAALIALYALALRRTAGLAAAGSALAALAAAGTGAVAGLPPWSAVGTALVAAGGTAVAWVLGRSQRRRGAERAALAAYRTGTAAIPRFAALAERDRLAVELHDVAAHRLTAIVVSAAAAQRLADPDLIADALRHAADAGRRAVAELDELADRRDRAGAPASGASLADIAALAAEFGADLHATPGAMDTVPATTCAVAYRMVREALTNTARYARGSAVLVTLAGGPELLTVTVKDDGGTAAEPNLGTGRGLTGLRTTVGTAGGTLSYGPTATGWTVHAELPSPEAPFPAPPHAVLRGAGFLRRGLTPTAVWSRVWWPGSAPFGSRTRGTVLRRHPFRRGPVVAFTPRRRHPLWRGPTALDWALVVLAVALSLGASLLSDDVPGSFRGVLSSLPFVLLSGLHAVPLGWRSRAPGTGLVTVLSALVLWWGCDRAGWTRPPVGDIFLVYWWVELTFVYSAGAYLPVRRGAWAPVAVAATGGLALASGSGITGSRAAAWAVLTVLLAGPAFGLWWLGVRTARRRERRRAAAARSRELLERDAETAVRDQRRLIAAGLLRTAHRHACDVVAAADAGRLDTVLAEARVGLAALRELLADLRARDGAIAPPPTVAGISALAARYGATVSYRGPRVAEPAVVGVAAYRVAAILLAEGVTLTVLRGAAGIEVSGPLPAAPDARRRVRAVADAMGGTLTRTAHDAVRVWLPEVFPSRSE